MRLKQSLVRWQSVAGLGLVGLLAGCPPVVPPPDGGGGGDGGGTTPPQAFLDASVTRGGSLYDKYWSVTGAAAPTGDHPRWASRPDQTSNTRTGADTWRCKECHGWDYKGKDGAYSSGSHRTGIGGIFGTALTAQEAFDSIKTAHSYGQAGLTDADLWDLAKFVLEGQIDTDTIIDGDGAFIGDDNAGKTLYDSGLGTTLACAACHGADGLAVPAGADADFGDFIGLIANDNSWEFQHKARFGQPGVSGMPGLIAGGGTTQDAGDLGAFAQTLPEAP